MGNINYNFLRPLGNAKRGIPQLMQPYSSFNGVIQKLPRGYKFQYMPSDHPDYETSESPRNLNDYTDEEMMYSVNKQGWRCGDMIATDDAVMTAGCSHTYGVGIRNDETWSFKLAKNFGLEQWNVGVGGIGPDVVALIVKQFFEEGYIPKVLCVLWPPHTRRLLMLDPREADITKKEQLMLDGNTDFGHPVWQWSPNMEVPEGNVHDRHAIQRASKAHLLKSIAQGYYEFWQARELVIALCKAHDVPLIEQFSTADARDYIARTCTHNIPTSPSVMGYTEDCDWDLARDGMHYGPVANRHVAKEFSRYINLDQL